VAIYLALDLILKHAVGLGHLTNYGEDLAAVSDLAELGLKRNLLAENEVVCWHVRYLVRAALLPVLRSFCAFSPPSPPSKKYPTRHAQRLAQSIEPAGAYTAFGLFVFV
jgi:hypothetical protein